MKANLTLLTDLYQLTMAYGYWKSGRAEDEAVFHLFFRKLPFKGRYAVASGLEDAIAFIEGFRFEADDLAYLATLTGNDDQPLFESAFLDYLAELKPIIDLDAIPEGTLVFPNEPLLRFTGPLILGQLLETPLLNLVNFQTLIATKAARIAKAARGEPVLEFGLRRAQGIDGAMSASRAAFVGGCAATSNVLAGKTYGIPVRGTHAHSWVMAFEDELESFETYADAMPANCVFLVDTYDTIEGVRKAAAVGQRLKTKGYRMAGIRLDSGDMAALSIEARKILDAAGLEDAAIVASNDLDEYEIEKLKQAGAKINVWGVGTRLVTAYDQPALGGVYKLAAIRKAGQDWAYKVKRSEDPIKVSNPGIQQVRRFKMNGLFAFDVLFDEPTGCTGPAKMDGLPETGEDLLVPVFRQGENVYDAPTLKAIRARTLEQLEQFNEDLPVYLDRALAARKAALLEEP